jgi:hypothetical protein
MREEYAKELRVYEGLSIPAKDKRKRKRKQQRANLSGFLSSFAQK